MGKFIEKITIFKSITVETPRGDVKIENFKVATNDKTFENEIREKLIEFLKDVPSEAYMRGYLNLMLAREIIRIYGGRIKEKVTDPKNIVLDDENPITDY